MSKQGKNGERKEARLNIVVSTAYRARVKREALKRGVTVRALVLAAVDKYLQKAA